MDDKEPVIADIIEKKQSDVYEYLKNTAIDEFSQQKTTSI